MGQSASIVVDSAGVADLHGEPLAERDTIPMEELRQHAQQMRILNLSKNALRLVPPAILELHALRQLDLSSNRLSQLPDIVLQLPLLERLDVSSNQIEAWPQEPLRSKSLMSLFVGKNRLSSVPSAFLEGGTGAGAELPRLAAIFMQENAIDIQSIAPEHRELFHGVEYQAVGQEIVEGLWLGSRYCAENAEWLAQRGIRHVLTLANARKRDQPVRVAPGCESLSYKRVFVDDVPSAAPQLAAMLDDCTEHLAAIAADIGSGAVLVHCTQGVSRSATVVAALLMRTDCSLTAAQAVERVAQRRWCVNPNKGFREALVAYGRKDQVLVSPPSEAGLATAPADATLATEPEPR